MKAKMLIALLSIVLIGSGFNANAQSDQDFHITKCPLGKETINPESGDSSVRISQNQIFEKTTWRRQLQVPFIWRWDSHHRYNRFVDNVVIVETPSGGGTGVIIDDHRILTCAHIVETEALNTIMDGSGNILFTHRIIIVDSIVKITFSDGLSIEGRVVKCDHDKDLAEISIIFHPPARAVKMGKCPQIGDKIFAIGHPKGLFYSYSEGSIMYPRRSLEGIEMFQADMTSFFGSSGSPVFNGKGELIGIVDAIIPGTSITFAISANEIEKFLDE